MKKEPEMVIEVREFDPERDCSGVEAVETMCDVGTGKVSLFTDQLGDPVSRVRHSPAFLMLVAEAEGATENVKEIVGLIRGCIKTVTCGTKTTRNGKPPSPLYTKLAYILGLRVSTAYRRRGIAMKLVTAMERWFNSMGAEYSYMATSKGNEASLRLFTGRCGYSEFRTPSILVQPVFAHRLRCYSAFSSSTTTIFRLSPSDAASLYHLRFSTTEFFPRDIDSILFNPLSLGTFLAVKTTTPYSWPNTASAFLIDPPESWAVISIWNCKEVFRLEVRGASRVKRGLAKTTRVFDRAFPWLRIPSVPNLFRPFGFYFLYGIGGDGPDAAKMVKKLCSHAHNMAMEGGCGVLVTEVAKSEPLRIGIPHWKRFSMSDDMWCVKRLGEEYSDGAIGDWTKSAPGSSIFVDPREL